MNILSLLHSYADRIYAYAVYLQSRKSKKPKGKTGLSVPSRLNFLNAMVFFSGLLSIFGAYEIQLGGTMHKLNYLHAKNTHTLADQIDLFAENKLPIDSLKTAIINVRKQPESCLDLTSAIDRAAMRLLGTYRIVDVCRDDIILAENILQAISSFQQGTIDKASLMDALEKSTIGFTRNGKEFQPLVDKTVSSVFFIIIVVVIGKAVLVPLFGVILSKGVSKDYILLAHTKNRLIKEREKNDAIQAEKISSISTMVASIAHEVNTPVSISVTAASHLSWSIETLSKAYRAGDISHEDIDEFFKSALETSRIINHNLERSSEIISGFKRVAVDQSTESRRDLNLHYYISEVLTSLSPALKKKQHTLTFKCPEDLHVITYPGALSQIITNLITNSIAHAFGESDHGHISIEIRQRNIINKPHLQLVYEDTGKGIPKASLSKIFDAFFTTKRNEGGTGLGLHVIHNLVTQQLGGNINVTSEEAAGVHFDIKWPIQMHQQANSQAKK